MAKKNTKTDKREKTKIYNPTAKTPDSAMNDYGNSFTNSVGEFSTQKVSAAKNRQNSRAEKMKPNYK